MNDADAFAEVVGLIYDAAINPESWTRVLERVAGLVGGGSAVLIKPSDPFSATAMISVGIDPEVPLRYARDVRGEDPLVSASARLPVGSVTTDRMLVPVAELRRTQYYNEFMVPLGIDTTLGVTLAPKAGSALAVARGRRQGEWPQEHIELVRRLTPHLMRAMEIGRRLEAADLRRTSADLLEAMPQAVVLVDADGRTVLANRAAQALLAEASALCLEADGLAAATADDTARLRRALARATRPAPDAVGGSVSLPRPGGAPLLALIGPLTPPIDWPSPRKPAAVVVVADPATRQASTAGASADGAAFAGGLARRELQCLSLVAGGASSKTIAADLGLSIHTVNQYIESSMRKLGAASRAEAAVMLAAPGSIAPSRIRRGIDA